MQTVILGIILLFLIVFVCIFICVVISLLTKSLFNGAYFAETSDARLQTIFELAEVTKHDHVLDIGAGDGRIVLAAAKRNVASSTGIEINPILVCISHLKLKLLKLNTTTEIDLNHGNLWQFDTSPYSVVILYGIPSMMSDLKKKLKKELKPGTKVISILFPIPGWKPHKHRNDIYLYTV